MKKESKKLTLLNDYEHDAMWMSYRYAIGRHTAAATMHAGNMIKNVYGRLDADKALFDAFDMRREIGYHLQWEFNFDMGITIPQQFFDPFNALIEFEKTLTPEEKQAGVLNYLKDHRVAVLVNNAGKYFFENHPPIHEGELYETQLGDLIIWANAANALDPNKHHQVTTKFSGEEKTYEAFEYITYSKINGFHICYTAIDNYIENPHIFTYISEEFITKIDGKNMNSEKLNEDEIKSLVQSVAEKTIGYDIEPTKFEDIPNKLPEILSKCIKRKVTVDGNGLDGKDITINID